MPEKLRIRVINAQSLDQGEAPKPQVVVEYYWNRIIAAVLLIVAVLAGVTVGLLHVFKGSGDKHPEALAQAANPVEPASTPHADGPILEPPKPMDSAKPVDNAPTGAPKPSTQETALPDKEGVRMPSVTQAEGFAPHPVQSASESVAASSARSTVAIFSSNIKRAQLTSGVSKDEPLDSIGQTIPMNAQGLLRVYLFMETDGLKGKILHHDWYWKGKRIAHARIPVKGNPHTAASSKFIDRIMMGPWEVKIVDERNRVLAQADFEVR
jgi:hypothetical protein